MFNVGSTIVWWQLDSRKHDLCTTVLAALNHVGHVGSRNAGVDAPQAVIGAQFDDDDPGLVTIEQTGKTRETTLCSISADTGVEDSISVTIVIQADLKEMYPGLVAIHAITGAETVAKNEQNRGIVS